MRGILKSCSDSGGKVRNTVYAPDLSPAMIKWEDLTNRQASAEPVRLSLWSIALLGTGVSQTGPVSPHPLLSLGISEDMQMEKVIRKDLDKFNQAKSVKWGRGPLIQVGNP